MKSPLSLSIAALITSGFAMAQVDPTDQRTSPPSTPTGEDLTTPVYEAEPSGGWWFDESLTHPSSRSAPENVQPLPPLEEVESQAQLFDTRASIRELMEAPLFMPVRDGVVWARTRDIRARFGENGFTAYPVFGKQSPREWPVHFEVVAASQGVAPLGIAVSGELQVNDSSVVIRRGEFDEAYHLGLDSIEQTFVFNELPASGDLTVTMAVHTELEATAGDERLEFRHPTFGAVTYGEAYVVDGSGRKEAIERAWDGESLSLVVPETFLADAVLPVTIDPPIAAFSSNFGVHDDSAPDITYAGGPGKYFVIWQEYTSAMNLDVYCLPLLQSGTQLAAFAVEMTNDFWATPRIAYCGANETLLVVASVTPSGPGTFPSSVQGQFINGANHALSGQVVYMSTIGSQKAQANVGGTNETQLTNNHFLVTWTRVISSSTYSIESRVIDWTRQAITGIQDVVNESGVRSRSCAISDSHGDANLPGEWWTVAWIRDTNQDVYGQVMARRIVWNGNLNLGAGTFLVESATDCQGPSVTSRFDLPLAGMADRPSIVAYHRRSTTGTIANPIDFSVFARVVIDGQAFEANSISDALEGFDGTIDQFGPVIGTNGRCFVMSYVEENYTSIGGGDWDTYMLSGAPVATGNGAALALSERHEIMGSRPQAEWQIAMAMVADGNNLATHSRGAAVWQRYESQSGGQIAGWTLQCNGLGISNTGPVGNQYCSAVPNSVGAYGGRYSSWLWINGDQSPTSVHVAHCIDLPPLVFGFLVCSPTSGAILHPGGSQGRLCLGSSFGRYSSQIASSGTNGVIDTLIDPQAIPQPNGTRSAVPGETWHFQMWHRDTVGGVATSNFSKAARLTFY